MKALTFLAMIFMATVSPAVEPQSWEELSSHIFTNAAIVWQAKTDALPKSFWTYKIIRPHAFSQTTISNAMVIAELPPKGIPKSPTNHMCIQDDCHCSCAIHCIFSTDPSDASIYFTSQLRTDSTQQIPADTNIVRWAWGYAHQLGLDWAQLQEKCMTSHFNSDTNGNPLTNQISGRGVYLSRLLDGIKFGSDGPDSTSCEGFWMEFGSHEIMNGYSLTWHDLQRDRQIPTASAAQIIQCIQAHKAFVLPEPKGGEDYFQTLKTLAYAKKLTITQLTPYYSEGVFAEVSKNGMPEAFMTPYAELQGAVDFGTSNTVVRIVAPIIASDIHRLLRK